MADTAVAITAGSGTNVDTRTEGTNGNHRQVIVIGDPATNAGVAPVDVTAGLKVDLGADNDVTITGSALTALQLIDDPVATLGTDTYTEATTKGMTIGAVRRDADTTLVNTTNEIGPLQMDANGRLKVEAFSGETLPVSFTGSTDVATQTTLASVLTSAQLIDDIVYTDDTSTHSTGSSKGALMMAAATPTDAAVNSNDIGALAMSLNRELLVSVNTALPAGTNAIGTVGHNITGIGHGVTTVTTAGTDVVLASSTACKRVMIQSQTDNTSLIAVGGIGVDATEATGTGIILFPGGSVDLQIDNLADIYIDSLVNGEGVRYTYFT